MRMYDHAERRREAVTRGSIWRSDPAAQLRGLAYSGRPGFLALGVDARELGLGHVHLAPDLERQRLGESLRDGRDGAQVRGHVLAGGAVPAGGTLDEPPALVAQRDGEAVDLELRDVARRRLVGAQQAAHARIERAQLGLVEGIAEAEHGRQVRDLGERRVRSAAHRAGRRIGRDQLRVRGLEVLELPEEAVVLGIGHDRRVQLVVGAVGRDDQGAQLGGAGGRVGRSRTDHMPRVVVTGCQERSPSTRFGARSVTVRRGVPPVAPAAASRCCSPRSRS